MTIFRIHRSALGHPRLDQSDRISQIGYQNQ
uniref:Uncharacterized protein n=1 Tax=Picea glauca TaxID=3330 RepID=A0A101LWQ9_PICGL|nr:hypothetical protein ABT39_MTgene1437 [Picea glauca]